MYGLTDASLMWFKSKMFYENDRTSTIMDQALFMWHHNDKFIAVTTLHVDGFLCEWTDLFY